MSEHLDLDALADALALQDDGGALPDHLQECPTCRAALTELEAALAPTDAALAALPEPELPADVAEPGARRGRPRGTGPCRAHPSRARQCRAHPRRGPRRRRAVPAGDSDHHAAR